MNAPNEPHEDIFTALESHQVEMQLRADLSRAQLRIHDLEEEVDRLEAQKSQLAMAILEVREFANHAERLAGSLQKRVAA